MTTQTFVETLVVMHCWKCHCAYGLSRDHYDRAQASKEVSFYCPNGHEAVFRETTEQSLQKKLDREARERRWYESQLTHTRDQLEATERSRAALKGHLTRARNKIANGVCPVAGCLRHFDNVQRHIQRMHPDWHLTDPEIGEKAVL